MDNYFYFMHFRYLLTGTKRAPAVPASVCIRMYKNDYACVFLVSEKCLQVLNDNWMIVKVLRLGPNSSSKWWWRGGYTRGGQHGVAEKIKGNPGHIRGQRSNTLSCQATTPGMFSRAAQGKSGAPHNWPRVNIGLPGQRLNLERSGRSGGMSWFVETVPQFL